jgi:mono/diheme cytochrome c family protein
MGRGWIGAGLGIALLAACGEVPAPSSPPSPPPPADPAARGEALFRTPVGGLSCADCHATTHEDQPDPARRRVGHSLADATRRPSWWHGSLDAAKGATVLDAALACVARFQHRTWNTTLPTRPDGTKDPAAVEVPPADRAALVAYLESLSRPGPHPASPAKKDGSLAAVARVRDLTGDAARGRAAWARACALCHGDGGGNAIGPSLRGGNAPDRFRVVDYCRNGPTRTDRESMDAWMPFFTPDALPDQDLADLAALIDGGEWEEAPRPAK